MSNPTSNFGWQMPTNTDLVAQLPADFEVFGQAVDTSLADLKGGTSGQVLAKNSNTDMDFVWVAQDDSNAIQNAIVDAKGDLIAATAADTPARLAIGTNGQVLTADSAEATGMKWATSASGGWTLLTSGNLTSNNVTVNFTSTGYKQIVIYVKDPSCTTDWYWNMRIGGNTGNNYNYVNTYSSSSSAATTVSYSAASGFGNDGPADLADYNAMGIWTIYDPDQATTRKIVTGSFGYRDNTNSFNASGWLVGQYFNTPAVVSSIDLYPSSTWSSGTYEVYGVK